MLFSSHFSQTAAFLCLVLGALVSPNHLKKSKSSEEKFWHVKNVERIGVKQQWQQQKEENTVFCVQLKKGCYKVLPVTLELAPAVKKRSISIGFIILSAHFFEVNK